MSSCTFCEIVNRNAPASVVHEDERVMSFLTIRPTRPGELVVIPKSHIDHFCDLDDELTAHVTLVAQQLGRRIREYLRPLRVGWVVSGFGVAHAHLIVVPLHDEHDIASGRHAYMNEGEVRFDPMRIPAVPRDQLDAMARRLSTPG